MPTAVLKLADVLGFAFICGACGALNHHKGTEASRQARSGPMLLQCLECCRFTYVEFPR